MKASAELHRANAVSRHASSMELVCPAESPAALRMAIDNGADSVCIEYRHTMAENALISFDGSSLANGIQYAHEKKKKVTLSIDLPMQAHSWAHMRSAIAHAADSGVDAIAFSDAALMLYCQNQYPDIPLHYSVPAESLNGDAIASLWKRFGIARLVLPKMTSLAEIEHIALMTSMNLEVFAHGAVDATAASRHSAVRSDPRAQNTCRCTCTSLTESDAIDATVDRCANDMQASNDSRYSTSAPSDSAALTLLPKLSAMGIRAVRINNRQPSIGRLAQATSVWREAIDFCSIDAEHYIVKPSWIRKLHK